MKSSRVASVLVGTVISLSGISFAEVFDPARPKIDLGKQEYQAKCALCHGDEGKGDGPYQGQLSHTVPDLTTLARRNGGVFPFQKTYEIIDGRAELKAHGMREMPIWGERYRAESFGTSDTHVPESYVRARILALNEYLYRLQAR